MSRHGSRVGQTVRFAALPDYLGNNQYRVESTGDGHQRVVVESEIIVQ